MSINCTAFIERDLCFSRIDPATATLSNQSQHAKLSLAFSLDGNENFLLFVVGFDVMVRQLSSEKNTIEVFAASIHYKHLAKINSGCLQLLYFSI
jgi:hypothetical protein